MKKILFTVLDGLGDKPTEVLGDKTPLEAADTYNLDSMAEGGISGLVEPIYTGALPTSEEGHFSLFGYDPNNIRIKRGFFTAEGVGLNEGENDVALRGNFATVDDKMNLIDRRAGRIKDTKDMIEKINGIKIKGVTFTVKSAKEHRVGIVLKGEGLSSSISDSDPFYSNLGEKMEKVKATEDTEEAKFTAEVLNLFLEKVHEILKDHPVNVKRDKEGKPIANYIITRGASSYQKISSFEEKYGIKAACVAGKPLYRQIGEFLGMHLIKVEGDNGLPSTNLEGKFTAALNALQGNDFVFLHIKGTDSLAEDGDCLGKKKFIEKIDYYFKQVRNIKNIIVVVTGDHSTCCGLKRHCRALIPLLIWGGEVDDVNKFSENQCKKGGLGKIEETDVLENVFKFSNVK